MKTENDNVMSNVWYLWYISMINDNETYMISSIESK